MRTPESILEEAGPLRPHELTYWLRALNGFTRTEAREAIGQSVFVFRSVDMGWDGKLRLS